MTGNQVCKSAEEAKGRRDEALELWSFHPTGTDTSLTDKCLSHEVESYHEGERTELVSWDDLNMNYIVIKPR